MAQKNILIGIFIGISIMVTLFLYQSPTLISSSDRLLAVCTTSIVADAVTNVGGTRVQVYTLMGPDVDPHTYHARESDVQKLISASIIFYNGLHLEGKMGLLLNRISQKIPVCAVTDGIDHALLRQSNFEGAYDPHVWFDVSLWIMCVQHIRDCLIKIDQVHASEYYENTDIYIQKLQALDKYIRERIAELPIEKRVLITAHDAFSYFGRAYGFKIISLQGISTDSEVGTRDVIRVIDYIVQHDVPAIFVEASIPQRNIEAVRYGVAAHGKNVILGPTLYSDALGKEGTVESTYLGMVRSVIDNIVTTLQRKVAP